MSISVSNGSVSGQAGNSGLSGCGVAAGSRKNPSGVSRMAKNNRSGGKKKKLNYNPREISQQILRAAKPIGASQVLVRARGKVGALERQRVTGQYDDNEIRVALAHARRMVKCARMKVNHLKEEEQLKKHNASTDEKRGQQKSQEIKRRVKTKKQLLKRKAEVEMKKLEQAQQMKIREETLRQRRRLNRNKEREEILDADMKYLKGDTGDAMDNQPASYGAVSGKLAGVIFEVSAQLAGLETELNQLDDEMERAIEQEAAAADMAADGMTGSEAPQVSAGDASAEMPVEAGSIDISV